MTESRWGRWAALAAIGALAALFASFNGGERVALSLGFTELYRVPLVLLIFIAFLAGMVTMFLLGLRHDLRVRRALREAGFGEPGSAEEAPAVWGDDDAAPADPEAQAEPLALSRPDPWGDVAAPDTPDADARLDGQAAAHDLRPPGGPEPPRSEPPPR